jgi:hypothetical protein
LAGYICPAGASLRALISHRIAAGGQTGTVIWAVGQRERAYEGSGPRVHGLGNCFSWSECRGGLQGAHLRRQGGAAVFEDACLGEGDLCGLVEPSGGADEDDLARVAEFAVDGAPGLMQPDIMGQGWQNGLCDVLGLRNPVVLGSSFGGFVTLTYAGLFPDHRHPLYSEPFSSGFCLCYRPRYLNIQRPNYLCTIQCCSTRIAGN